jgi:UPF0755 protein
VKKRYIIISTIIGFFFVSALIIWNEIQPVKNSDSLVISVEEGDSLDKIAEKLENQNKIKNRLLFQWYGRIKGYDRSIKAGQHKVAGRVTYDNIYSALIQNEDNENLKVIIPEGFTVEQIAERLAAKRIVDRDEFLEAAKTGSGISHPVINEIKKKEDIKYVVEGFLFPDTYSFEKNSSSAEVIEKLLSHFDSEMATVPNSEEIDVLKWVTLASLVEKEARVDKERAVIAGVFQNRIKREMKLQTDATVQYALKEPKERLLYEDLEIDSKYNTYRYEGLPPGPIANPGLLSLQAVLNATDHSYFFYVLKKDGTGEHYFSETYEQHQNKIKKARSN